MNRYVVSALFVVTVAACEDEVFEPAFLPPPDNLLYRLEPSGEPATPAGLVLRWDPVVDANLQAYGVYSRPGSTGPFGLRGETSSTSFHDDGPPDLEYYVVSIDLGGFESQPSDVVVIDERLRLEAPAWIASTSLDGAVHLTWADNPFSADPEGFEQYRVYSASYSLDDGLCDVRWFLEGTTVAPEFLAGALENGQPFCFAVSAESIEGFESLWSPLWADTPRPDARNVLVYAMAEDPTRSGFRFFFDVDGDGVAERNELGIVTSGTSPDVDFRVERDQGGVFRMVPVRVGTEVALYSAAPVEDLTSIDFAPEDGYERDAVVAEPGFGYVFQMLAGDAFPRYGAVRVTHVGRDFVIFDWSYQTDPGNPELAVGAGTYQFVGGKAVGRSP